MAADLEQKTVHRPQSLENYRSLWGSSEATQALPIATKNQAILAFVSLFHCNKPRFM